MSAQAAEPAARPRDPGAIPAAPIVALALPAPLRLSLALDLDRREAGKDPLLAASIDGDLLVPLRLASLYAPRGSGQSAPDFKLELGAGETLALSTQAMESLREALSTVALKGETITLQAALSAPFGLLYVKAEQRAYVNPIVLELRDTAEDRAFAEHVEDHLTYTRVCADSGADLTCLADALTLRPVERCVSRLDPRCLPAAGQTLGAVISAAPTCAFTIQACSVEPILDSPCAIPGPCGTPCSISGAQSGSACGRGCGQACGASCTACGVTSSCDRICTDFCSQPCGTQCAKSCEDDSANCGASCGASTSRSCTKTCGESGARHTGLWTDAVDEVQHPLPPPPPLDAREPPPLRAIAVTGARDGLAFVLPPLLFLWIRRRLGKERSAALPAVPRVPPTGGWSAS